MRQFFLALFIFILQTAQAQNITVIPDTNFRNFLMQQLPFVMNQNKELVNASAAAYTGMINCPYRNISDLTGIEKFTNLNMLYCYNNNISNIDGVKNLTKLTILHLDRNKVTSLPDLSAHTKLNTLYCSSNALTSLPDLSKNLALVYIDCFNNQITELKGIEKLVNLETLNCYNNAISSLPDVSNLTKLTVFQCFNNKLKTIPGLSKLTSLTYLLIGNNPIDTLPDLSALTKLQQLHAWNNQLLKAPIVSSMSNLATYYFSDNHFSTLPPFSSNQKEMQVFKCENNQLDSLPNSINYFINLQLLHIGQNKLNKIPSISNTRYTLKEFHAEDNLLSELPDFTNFNSLTEIQVQNNTLTFEDLLPLLKNTSVKSLFYSPQATIANDSLRIVTENQAFEWVLGIDKNVQSSTYSWYKNGTFLKTSTTGIFSIEKTALADSAVYTCQIRNPFLPALILYISPLRLKVKPCIDLSKLMVKITDYDCNIGGKITLKEETITGGTKPFTFSLTASESGKKHFASENVISNLFENNYKLEISDKSGCKSSTNITLKGKSGSECKNLVIILSDNSSSNSLTLEETGIAKIFDKNGTLVKSITTPSIWDGTLSNGEVIPGLYIMELNGKFSNVTVIK